MIVRIVKMSFQDDQSNVFLKNFEVIKEKVLKVDGCHLLELYRDKHDPSLFFTYSCWESEDHLEMYRKSDMFQSVWTRTKLLFKDKPQAWSTNRVDNL